MDELFFSKAFDQSPVGMVFLKGDGTVISANPALAAMLKNEERNIRWAAVRALGDIGDKGAVAPLLDSVETDSSTYVRQSAIEALGKIGDKDAAPALAKFLDDKDAAVKRWASFALGTLGYEK